MSRFSTVTLGCKVNTYENNKVKELLISNNLIFDENNPTIIVINTCCVTNVSSAKSRQKIRKMKNTFPTAKIIVMGCYADTDSQELADLPIDLIVKKRDSDEILVYLKNQGFINEINRDNLLKTNLDKKMIRSYLKISDGCDNYCSYCIIPYARGPIKSKLPDEVIAESKELIRQGSREIILTGINIGAYGKDLEDYNFVKLLHRILNETTIEQIRISSIEYNSVDEEFIQLLAANQRIARHIHLPLQSGSDRILTAMNRHYTIEEFKKKVLHLQALHIEVTTDIIVGFPGESEEDFLSTLKMVRECRFLKVHAFEYSLRTRTVAAMMDEQISPQVKQERQKRLISESEKIAVEIKQSYIGKIKNVLVEKVVNGIANGHTSEYLNINISNFSKEDNIINQFTPVLIKENNSGQLSGIIYKSNTN